MEPLTVVTDDNLRYFKQLQDSYNDGKFAYKGGQAESDIATNADISALFPNVSATSRKG